MWKLARGYKERRMAAYVELQEEELQAELEGYGAVKHQSFVGAGFFDRISQICGESSTAALKDSTEAQQFTGGLVHNEAR
jgi:isocitrate lyase